MVSTHQTNSVHSRHSVASKGNTQFEIDHNKTESQSGQIELLQSESPPCSMSLGYPKSSGASVSQLLSMSGTDVPQNQMKDWPHTNSGTGRNLISHTCVFGDAQLMFMCKKTNVLISIHTWRNVSSLGIPMDTRGGNSTIWQQSALQYQNMPNSMNKISFTKHWMPTLVIYAFVCEWRNNNIIVVASALSCAQVGLCSSRQ